MTIDYPAAGQVPQLKNLWKAAFGDPDEFIDPFFEIAYAPDRCRCITIDGQTAAMLYWFETTCDEQRFAYIYAVATDPGFRNRGLCRILMEDAASVLKSEGYDGILLYPASEGLVQMYAKMGFAHCTAVGEFECEAAPEPAALRKIGKAEYARLRRELLPEGGAVQEGAVLDFLAGQAEFCAGENWVAVVSVYDGKLHCHELLGDVEAAPGILKALGQKDGFFRTFGGRKPFAMGRALGESCKFPVYFGLPLD